MEVRLYTDGACSGNPGPGGWGVVISQADKIEILSGGDTDTTNNRMELLAMLEAMRYINNEIAQGHGNVEYHIFSDSAYVVNAIVNDWLTKWALSRWRLQSDKPVKNSDLWKRVLQQRSRITSAGTRCKIHKIKGHAGHSMNEMADRIAKEECFKAKAIQ